MEGEIVVSSSSGATSTKLEEAYNLIPFAAIQAMARRFWLGSQKHAPRNWERAIEARDYAFAEERLKHAYRHMALYAEYRRQEDLDAVLCNAAMLAHFAEHGLLPERPHHASTGSESAHSPAPPAPASRRIDELADRLSQAGATRQARPTAPGPFGECPVYRQEELGDTSSGHQKRYPNDVGRQARNADHQPQKSQSGHTPGQTQLNVGMRESPLQQESKGPSKPRPVW